MIMLFSVAPKDTSYTPKPKRRKYKSSSSSSPKTLPWFDKDYLKRKERKREREFWKGVRDADKFF